MNITQNKYSTEETVINLENFLNKKGIKGFCKNRSCLRSCWCRLSFNLLR